MADYAPFLSSLAFGSSRQLTLPTEEQPALAMHIEEPHIPESSVSAPLPTTPVSSVPPKPLASNTVRVPQCPTHTDLAGPSSSTPPPQHITIYTRDFLAIMDAIHTFSITSASFVVAIATLAERMSRTEAALAQNQAILVQIQSHLGLPPISPLVPAQASLVHPPSVPPTQPTPAAPLDLLAAAAVVATPPATPVVSQSAQDEDDLPPATH